MILFITWMIYAILEGYREAYYWHYKSLTTDKLKFNIHIIFTIQRFIVMSICIFLHILMVNFTWVDFLLTIVAYTTVFSFLHNGMYYTIRNYITPTIYIKKWFDQSTTSTALTTKIFTPLFRTILFIVGVLIEIILI